MIGYVDFFVGFFFLVGILVGIADGLDVVGAGVGVGFKVTKVAPVQVEP